MAQVSFTDYEQAAVVECIRDRRDRLPGMYAMLARSNPVRCRLENEEMHLTVAIGKFAAAAAAKAKRRRPNDIEAAGPAGPGLRTVQP